MDIYWSKYLFELFERYLLTWVYYYFLSKFQLALAYTAEYEGEEERRNCTAETVHPSPPSSIRRKEAAKKSFFQVESPIRPLEKCFFSLEDCPLKKELFCGFPYLVVEYNFLWYILQGSVQGLVHLRTPQCTVDMDPLVKPTLILD